MESVVLISLTASRMLSILDVRSICGEVDDVVFLFIGLMSQMVHNHVLIRFLSESSLELERDVQARCQTLRHLVHFTRSRSFKVESHFVHCMIKN